MTVILKRIFAAMQKNQRMTAVFLRHEDEKKKLIDWGFEVVEPQIAHNFYEVRWAPWAAFEDFDDFVKSLDAWDAI